MLAQACQKSESLDAPAQWIEADVLNTPTDLDGTADLVYTGKGALPWVMDLEQWAKVVLRILKSGGVLYIFEGHPLDWVWEPDENSYVPRSDGGDYFDQEPRPNRDFPGRAVGRRAPSVEEVPEAVEFQWTLGQIVTSLAEVGLRILKLEEHPLQFWPKYGHLEEPLLQRLPHTFSLLAKKP
jgi:SAM-dependent methyltransferase